VKVVKINPTQALTNLVESKTVLKEAQQISNIPVPQEKIIDKNILQASTNVIDISNNFIRSSLVSNKSDNK